MKSFSSLFLLNWFYSVLIKINLNKFNYGILTIS